MDLAACEKRENYRDPCGARFTDLVNRASDRIEGEVPSTWSGPKIGLKEQARPLLQRVSAVRDAGRCGRGCRSQPHVLAAVPCSRFPREEERAADAEAFARIVPTRDARERRSFS
jgi:hypothetical protein